MQRRRTRKRSIASPSYRLFATWKALPLSGERLQSDRTRPRRDAGLILYSTSPTREDSDVHAELRIEHKGGDLVPRLADVFGPDNRAVLERSVLLSQNPAWASLVAYAAEKTTLRLVCFVATSYELQLMVEAVQGGDLKASCETVWSAMRRSPRRQKVRFLGLRLVDSASGQMILDGRPGLWSNLARTELWPALVIGLVTSIWLGISLTRGGDVVGLVSGSIPALVLACLAFLWLISTRRRLAWSG